MVRRSLERIASVVFAAALLLSLPVCADAERPEDAPEKGSAASAAESILIADERKTDAFENIPVEVGKVKIGLCYDQESRYEVSLYNMGGHGFQLGRYDEARVFHAQSELASPSLTIRSESRWLLLYDEAFPDEAGAADFAARNDASAVKINHEDRVSFGSCDSLWEAELSIEARGLQAKAWRLDSICLYDGAGELLHLQDAAEDLAIQAISEEKSLTYFDDEVYYGGFLLHLDAVRRLSVINVVDLEDYVKGVIPYEMSPSWPVEALKAQAVCARTYAAYNIDAFEEYGFDLTDDTESQVYRGVNGADAVTDAAVDATAGQFIRYRGELCEIYYFASDGGATEDGANVFFADRPYLAGKLDPFEAAVEPAIIVWERWRDGESIGRLLRQNGEEIGDVVSVVPEYSELGNVIAVRYEDEQGRAVRLRGRESYAILGLSNCRFTVEKTDDGFSFSGRGWGHNCGMSQWGANAMAGIYGYSYQQILAFYFTGAYCA